jgi:N-acetylglucosamine-6-phosphate deacetylase
MQTITGRNVADGISIDVAIEDGLIQSIQPSAHPSELWLSAGLIDLQVNGYGGDDLNTDPLTADTVIQLAKKLAAVGTTTFLPTLITASEKSLLAALRAIAEARGKSSLARHMIPFVHLEGPHISPEDGFRGAHPIEHVRPPNVDEFDRWQHASGGIIGMVTMSPHSEHSVDYMKTLVSRGVLVALGHTSATRAQIEAAVAAGASLSTHLGNGIAQQLPRHPNALWTQLGDDRLTATLIADGHHLPTETLKVMVRAKGVSRCILVSDTVALAGMRAGEYTTPVGGNVTLSAHGRLTLSGSQLLAGAALPLRDTVLKVMQMCELNLADAFRMATENPGRFMGRGRLQVGAHADLIQFAIYPRSTSLDLHKVLLRGENQIQDSSILAESHAASAQSKLE